MSESLSLTHTHTPLTQHMELLVEKGLTRVVGVADLMRPHLAELYHWASVSSYHTPHIVPVVDSLPPSLPFSLSLLPSPLQVKPMIDQLNLAHCCMIPEVSLQSHLLYIHIIG